MQFLRVSSSYGAVFLASAVNIHVLLVFLATSFVITNLSFFFSNYLDDYVCHGLIL
jgi:hypothetical protein